jgi:flagellar biosynthetic protein FliO
MRQAARWSIGLPPVTWVLKRKRILLGLGVLASLFVIMALISSVATSQTGRGPADSEGEVSAGTTDERTGAESPAEVPDPGIGGMAFKVIGSVLLLIGVLYAGMYAMRVLSGRTGRQGFNSDAISVLHKRHIAPKKAIYVLKVGGRAMVLGVTDSQISHLSDLSDTELDALKIPKGAGRQTFKQQLLGFALGGREES